MTGGSVTLWLRGQELVLQGGKKIPLLDNGEMRQVVVTFDDEGNEELYVDGKQVHSSEEAA